MKLTSFEQLERALVEDEKRKDTKIVRFINVESLEQWCKVKNLLVSRSENCIQMSQYCSAEDLTPNMNRIIRALKEINGNSLLVPLSEHLRINRNAGMLGQIANLQFKSILNSHYRLYVPVYKMGAALKELIKSDARLESNVLFLQAASKEDEYSLVILPRNLQTTIKGNNIDGYRRYLAYWESNPNMPIILHTDNAFYYRDYTFADNVKVIDSAYEILRHLSIIGEEIDKSWGEDWCWLRLLSQDSAGKSIFEILSAYFGIPRFDEKVLMSKWGDGDDFSKWLTWLWLRLEAKTPYMRQAILSSQAYHSVPSSVANALFDIDPADKMYEILYRERKDLLLVLRMSGLPSSFWERYADVDEDEKLFRLTDCTELEREEIIRLFSRLGDDERKKSFLRLAYGQLYNYLTDFPFEEMRITEYFSKYKTQKLQNGFTEEFVHEVTDIARLKGIWWKLRIKSRNEIIDKYYTANSKIIWIDALGVEFLGLIRAMLDEEYPGCQRIMDVGYAALPTITELNKDFTSNRVFAYVKDLDDLVHNGQFPGYISQQLELVHNQVKKAISSLDDFDRVIITSDHGATRGAVRAKGASIQVTEGGTVERAGRFCVDEINKYESKYDFCIDMDRYHVLGNYDRFSVQGAAKNESHGGATLEEVLVPVIILSRKQLLVRLEIDLLTPAPRMQLGRVLIKFKINKDTDNVSAFVGTKRYDCSNQEGCWVFEADCDQRSEYKVRIVTGFGEGTFEYKVNKGRTDNKNFDL